VKRQHSLPDVLPSLSLKFSGEVTSMIPNHSFIFNLLCAQRTKEQPFFTWLYHTCGKPKIWYNYSSDPAYFEEIPIAGGE